MTATSTPLAGTTAGRTRLPGPDVVRAVALIGVVVMNYNGYLLLQQEAPRSTDALHRCPLRIVIWMRAKPCCSAPL